MRKPEPLRYRIDPIQKKLDELDALERELRSIRNSMDDEDYHALANVLIKRRQKLAPKSACNEPVSVFEPEPILSYWIRSGRLETPFKWLLGCFVLWWIFFKNF